MDARLDAQLARAVLDRLVHAPRELLAVVLVGVGRALALAEAAEGAADGADVRDVDVAVDHERDRLPRQLRAQLVGGLAHRLDRLRARLGEHRRQLVGAQRDALAALLDRARHQIGANRRRWLGASGAAARNEAPVLDLDRVEHRRRDPLGVDVPRIDAQALGQRDALALQLLANLMGRGKGMLGRDVVAVRREAAEIGGARRNELAPPVGEVRRHLNTDVGQQTPGLGDQTLHVVDRDRARPLGQRQVRPLKRRTSPSAATPVRQ